MISNNYSGLNNNQVKLQIQKFGYNLIEQKKITLFKKIILQFKSIISLMLLGASILSYITNEIFDAHFILLILLINIFITLMQEKKADNAVRQLNENLKSFIMVFRNGKWIKIDSKNIVPDDIAEFNGGDVICADAIILESYEASVDESTLTGESMPINKKVNDKIFSGSFLKNGKIITKITATGKNTYFGKTLFSIEKSNKKSSLEKDIILISKFLSITSFIAIIILTIIMVLNHINLAKTLILDLSLLIAGIPVSMPTVTTLITMLGVIELAKKKVIIRRISALEDLSNVNYILSDKTGTLTRNKITIQEIKTYNNFSEDDLMIYASTIALADDENSISEGIIEYIKNENIKNIKNIKGFIPANSQRKRATILANDKEFDITISLGAPQVIKSLCEKDDKLSEEFDNDVMNLAERGYRTIAISILKSRDFPSKIDEKNMKLVGILALSDDIRRDAKNTIKFLKENGINISIVTGDHEAIAKEVAIKTGIMDDGKMVIRKDGEIKPGSLDRKTLLTTAAFSETLPGDKAEIIKQAQKYFTVASNGDGINDLPALMTADVGIAVQNAVPALKSTADIVLMSNGISVIKDAIVESRKIFQRLYGYSLYRISESFRLIITITILGVINGVFPLTPVQLILIAVLNDMPIISLAFNKTEIYKKPAKIDVKKRFILSSGFGLVGVFNSLLLYFVCLHYLHFSWEMIETAFFLKLTVSGHLLIFVAHTKKLWYKFLPSNIVMYSIFITQGIATILALSGLFMPIKLSLFWVGGIWLWSIFWMQISELVKIAYNKIIDK